MTLERDSKNIEVPFITVEVQMRVEFHFVISLLYVLYFVGLYVFKIYNFIYVYRLQEK